MLSLERIIQSIHIMVGLFIRQKKNVMKNFKLKSVISLFAALLLFACNENLLREDMTSNFEQDVFEVLDDENFVSPKQALEIAEKLFSRGTDVQIRSSASASIAMYVVNFPGGGSVIVSATKMAEEICI